MLLSHVQLFATTVDCSPPGSSDHGIFQARILGWVAISFARGSSRPRDQTHISCNSCISRWFLYQWATSEAYSRLGSSLHQFCPHLFGQDSVTWCHLNAREAGKCSQAMCPGVKDLGADSAIYDGFAELQHENIQTSRDVDSLEGFGGTGFLFRCNAKCYLGITFLGPTFGLWSCPNLAPWWSTIPTSFYLGNKGIYFF